MSVNPSALCSIIGSRVRAARERANLSQAKLAQKLGMTRTSVVNIEAGRQRPPIHVLWEIAEELKTEVALLLPTRSDYDEEIEPVELDAKTVSEFEAAVNGDSKVRRNLIDFIGRAKKGAREQK